MGCIREDDREEYRAATLLHGASKTILAKTKELVVDRRRNRRLEASVSIYGCLCGDSRQLQYLSVYNGNELDFI